MNDRDVPQSEMPHLPSWRRHGEPTDPAPLDELVGDGQVSPAVSPEWQLVSELLQAAAGPASEAELTVENAAFAAFRRAHLGSPIPRPLVRPRMISTILTGKIAAALACAAVGITGAAGAAFAGALPTHIQNAAHDTIGAPRADHDATTTSTEPSHTPEASESPEPSDSPEASESPEATHSPKASHSPEPSDSPDASQSAQVSATSTASPGANAAFGLCQAWSNAVKHGLETQVGFRDKLAALAGGLANVTTFCASVKHTEGNHTESPSPSSSVSSAATSSDEHGNGDGDGNGHGNKGVIPALSPTP
jgi:hypothetical protein